MYIWVYMRGYVELRKQTLGFAFLLPQNTGFTGWTLAFLLDGRCHYWLSLFIGFYRPFVNKILIYFYLLHVYFHYVWVPHACLVPSEAESG